MDYSWNVYCEVEVNAAEVVQEAYDFVGMPTTIWQHDRGPVTRCGGEVNREVAISATLLAPLERSLIFRIIWYATGIDVASCITFDFDYASDDPDARNALILGCALHLIAKLQCNAVLRSMEGDYAMLWREGELVVDKRKEIFTPSALALFDGLEIVELPLPDR